MAASNIPENAWMSATPTSTSEFANVGGNVLFREKPAAPAAPAAPAVGRTRSLAERYLEEVPALRAQARALLEGGEIEKANAIYATLDSYVDSDSMRLTHNATYTGKDKFVKLAAEAGMAALTRPWNADPEVARLRQLKTNPAAQARTVATFGLTPGTDGYNAALGALNGDPTSQQLTAAYGSFSQERVSKKSPVDIALRGGTPRTETGIEFDSAVKFHNDTLAKAASDQWFGDVLPGMTTADWTGINRTLLGASGDVGAREMRDAAFGLAQTATAGDQPVTPQQKLDNLKRAVGMVSSLRQQTDLDPELWTPTYRALEDLTKGAPSGRGQMTPITRAVQQAAQKVQEARLYSPITVTSDVIKQYAQAGLDAARGGTPDQNSLQFRFNQIDAWRNNTTATPSPLVSPTVAAASAPTPVTDERGRPVGRQSQGYGVLLDAWNRDLDTAKVAMAGNPALTADAAFSSQNQFVDALVDHGLTRPQALSYAALQRAIATKTGKINLADFEANLRSIPEINAKISGDESANAVATAEYKKRLEAATDKTNFDAYVKGVISKNRLLVNEASTGRFEALTGDLKDLFDTKLRTLASNKAVRSAIDTQEAFLEKSAAVARALNEVLQADPEMRQTISALDPVALGQDLQTFAEDLTKGALPARGEVRYGSAAAEALALASAGGTPPSWWTTTRKELEQTQTDFLSKNFPARAVPQPPAPTTVDVLDVFAGAAPAATSTPGGILNTAHLSLSMAGGGLPAGDLVTNAIEAHKKLNGQITDRAIGDTFRANLDPNGDLAKQARISGVTPLQFRATARAVINEYYKGRYQNWEDANNDLIATITQAGAKAAEAKEKNAQLNAELLAARLAKLRGEEDALAESP